MEIFSPSSKLSGLLFLLVSLLSTSIDATIVTEGPLQLDEGAFTYYYDDSIVHPCQTVFFFGVGTAMQTTDYSKLSQDIVEDQSILVVVIDDYPNRIRKQDPLRYAKLVNFLFLNMDTHIPMCKDNMQRDIVIGGHSASGQAAISALGMLDFVPIGFVGFAPFQVPADRRIDIPALFWGFSRSSCSVDASKAAELGYAISNKKHRVFYQIQTNNFNTITGGPHCVFADSGCLSLCSPEDMQWVRGAVGKTLSVFIRAIQNPEYFKREIFEAVLPPDTILFFNQDMIKKYQ